MNRFLLPFRQSKILNIIFLSNIFINLHYALIIYLNSSYLSNFFSEGQVSALYIIGSALETVMLLNASKILEKIGNFKFIVYVTTIEFLSTLGLALSSAPFLDALFFLCHVMSISLIVLNMDVFLESASKNENETGEIRATYLTMAAIVFVIAPALLAVIVLENIYSYVYLASAIFILPLYFLIKKLKKIETKKIDHIKIKETVYEYLKNSDLYNIFISQFLLQFFFAFMIVYTPIYLSKYMGFSWTEIGFIFSIMLVPFVIFEVPVGELADTKYGEKEFLTIGFIVMGLSTLFISFITAKLFWMWAVVLFITRIGASVVETSTESYFFKKVNQEKTGVISLFRAARPISFIFAPILVTLSLQFIPFQYLFIIIGSIMIVGSHYSLALSDTR